MFAGYRNWRESDGRDRRLWEAGLGRNERVLTETLLVTEEEASKASDTEMRTAS